MARYLLDTHVFLWAVTNNPRLRSATNDAITSGANDTFVSVASIWEISIKQGIGKMPELPGDPDEMVDETGFDTLDINATHARVAGQLPLLHRDPFDRMLVAQAQIEDLVLITDDPGIEQYGVATLRP